MVVWLKWQYVDLQIVVMQIKLLLCRLSCYVDLVVITYHVDLQIVVMQIKGLFRLSCYVD